MVVENGEVSGVYLCPRIDAPMSLILVCLTPNTIIIMMMSLLSVE